MTFAGGPVRAASRDCKSCQRIRTTPRRNQCPVSSCRQVSRSRSASASYRTMSSTIAANDPRLSFEFHAPGEDVLNSPGLVVPQLYDWNAKTNTGKTALEIAAETLAQKDLEESVRSQVRVVQALLQRPRVVGIDYIFPCMDPGFCRGCNSLPCKLPPENDAPRMPGSFSGTTTYRRTHHVVTHQIIICNHTTTVDRRQ